MEQIMEQETVEEKRGTGLLSALQDRLPRRSGPKKPGKKRWTVKRVILLAVLAAALVACGIGLYFLFFAEEERTAVTGTTTYGYLNEALEGSGTTTPADSVTYTVSGTVLEWYVETGDEVEEGSFLMLQS